MTDAPDRVRGSDVEMKRRRLSWQEAPPGGKVEWGEPLEAAMVRELAEETGLSVCSQGQLATFETVNRDKAGEITHHFIIHMFRCGRLGLGRRMRLALEECR